jgi:hypothetical protein
MKIFFILTFVLSFISCFSQWKRVEQLPSSDIASLYHKNGVLYAGGKNVIYISKNNGLTWDSTSVIPQLFLVTSIIIYENNLYAAAPNRNVFKSADGGTTWQSATWQGLTPGTFPDVADFCEFMGELYAATFGNSVYKLNSASENSWLSFSNGLSDLSANLPVIASNSNVVISGTLANGIYGRLPANSMMWQERLLRGQLDPNEGCYSIIAAHDTLFYSGRTGKFYISTDNALNWDFIGEKLPSAATTMANAKQAILVSRHIFEDSFKTLFYYLKKDSLQNSFVNFSVVGDAHFTYKIDILSNKLWDASNKGLFFMSLSDLPGISAADEGVPITLPLRFTSLVAKCQEPTEYITWKTSGDQNSSHFTVERRSHSSGWTTVGVGQATGNSASENSFSFIDHDPVQNSYYRIAQHDLDGKMQYSGVIKSSCNSFETFTSFPNPFHDKLLINITADKPSEAVIKLTNSRGEVVRLRVTNIVQGNNQVSVDATSLPAGPYQLSATWGNGQSHKTSQVLKL